MVAGLMLVSVCGRLAALLGPAGVGRPLPGWLISTLCPLSLQAGYPWLILASETGLQMKNEKKNTECLGLGSELVEPYLLPHSVAGQLGAGPSSKASLAGNCCGVPLRRVRVEEGRKIGAVRALMSYRLGAPWTSFQLVPKRLHSESLLPFPGGKRLFGSWSSSK